MLSFRGAQRGRMGIESTWRLCRRHAGFEARGGHQSRVHPQTTQVLLWQHSHPNATSQRIPSLARVHPSIGGGAVVEPMATAGLVPDCALPQILMRLGSPTPGFIRWRPDFSLRMQTTSFERSSENHRSTATTKRWCPTRMVAGGSLRERVPCSAQSSLHGDKPQWWRSLRRCKRFHAA